MIRFLCFLAALLLPSGVLAAPAPQPQPFVSGWSKPVDPDGDCTIAREKGALTIEIPGNYHDYNPGRQKFNAPRLFREREIEGDFVLQVRVRIDCRPSFRSAVEGQPSFVSAGFLVIRPDNVCIREEFRVSQKGGEVDGCVASIIWGHAKGRGRSFFSEKGWKGDAYLRLERQGGDLNLSISSDGEHWKGLGTRGGKREKLKIGLAAYSTSTDPSKVVFDQLTIRYGEKKRRSWDFVSGWDNPIDPDTDCKIKRDKDSATIEMPGSDHDYHPLRKCFNAPRIISDLEGEFDVQVRVRIESHPSAPSAVAGEPSVVSAGFLLIYPEPEYPICDRLEYAVAQEGSRLDGYIVWPQRDEPRRNEPMPKGKEADHYAVMKSWVSARQRKGNRIEWNHKRPERLANLLWKLGSRNWPLPETADYVYLRLDHRLVGRSSFYISPDGEKWTRLEDLRHAPANCKVGLAAYSTSSEPSKVRFDQLKLARGNMKKIESER